MPSLLLTSAVLLSSRMISMHNSTHSSQMNTVGPAMSLRTSCWLLPQKEQYSVFLESVEVDFVIGCPWPPAGGFHSTYEKHIASLVTGLLSLRPLRRPQRNYK